MVCRPTPGLSDPMGLANIDSGLDDDQIQSLVHQLRHEYAEGHHHDAEPEGGSRRRKSPVTGTKRRGTGSAAAPPEGHVPIHHRGGLQATLDFGFQQQATKFGKGKPTAEMGELFASDDYYTAADSNAQEQPRTGRRAGIYAFNRIDAKQQQREMAVHAATAGQPR